MRVRLTKKFAEVLDGVDLSRSQVGESLDVTRQEAELLLAEGWAEPVHDDTDVGAANHLPDEQRTPRSIDALRLVRIDMEEQSQAEHERRRLEERIREEHHDARAKTIPEEPA